MWDFMSPLHGSRTNQLQRVANPESISPITKKSYYGLNGTNMLRAKMLSLEIGWDRFQRKVNDYG